MIPILVQARGDAFRRKGGGILGIDCQGPVGGRNRFLAVIGKYQRQRQIAERTAVIRILANRTLRQGHGLIEFPEAKSHFAGETQDVNIIWRAAHRGIQLTECLWNRAALIDVINRELQ